MSRGKAHVYNEVTAVLLAALLRWYYTNDGYLRDRVLKHRQGSYEETMQWLTKTEQSVDELIGKMLSKPPLAEEMEIWGCKKVNIMSIVYKLTLADSGLGDKDLFIIDLTTRILALPSLERERLYPRILTRLRYIEKELAEVVGNMDIADKIFRHAKSRESVV